MKIAHIKEVKDGPPMRFVLDSFEMGTNRWDDTDWVVVCGDIRNSEAELSEREWREAAGRFERALGHFNKSGCKAVTSALYAWLQQCGVLLPEGWEIYQV